MPIKKKVNKDFFKIWSPEMAYVLGFFAADGYITINKRGAQFWCIQICDKELLENIRKSIWSEHTIGVRASHNENEKIIYRLQIGSIEMCNDLRKLGYTENKTHSLSLSSIPQKYMPHFVRGYFDGDGNVWSGYIHKERTTKTLCIQTVFTSCSLRFLELLQNRLLEFGFGKGCLREIKEKTYRLSYSIEDSLKLYNFMYNHTVLEIYGFFCKEKRQFLRNLYNCGCSSTVEHSPVERQLFVEMAD